MKNKSYLQSFSNVSLERDKFKRLSYYLGRLKNEINIITTKYKHKNLSKVNKDINEELNNIMGIEDKEKVQNNNQGLHFSFNQHKPRTAVPESQVLLKKSNSQKSVLSEQDSPGYKPKG